MGELDSLEKQICALIQKNQELSDANAELLLQKERLKKENEVLKLKVEESENIKSDSAINNHFDDNVAFAAKDRELIRKQIDELVKVIDHHLST